MKRILAIIALLGGVATPALAAKQQVSPSTYHMATQPPVYGRSDGVIYNKTTLIPQLVQNGDGFMPIGPTYEELFSYGDGLGVTCYGLARPVYTLVSGANTACSTTCATTNTVCVSGFDNGAADAEAQVACSDNTADVCTCLNQPLDEVLVGCGANWEAPALGISLLEFNSGVKLAHVALLQQDIGPDMDAGGLDIAGDQTNNDGVELIGGMFGASGRPFVPGTDPAFKFCVSIDNDDESGSDELWIGFREAELPLAVWNNYNSYFAVGMASGDFKVEHEDDGANAASTDTTLDYTEGAVTRLCVQVSDARVATCTVDGATPSSGCDGEYTFDAGVPVVPIVHFLHDSDVADAVTISEWELTFPH